MAFTYDSLVDSLQAFLCDPAEINDTVRDDARIFIQRTVGSQIYVGRRSQSAGNPVAITLDEITDEVLYQLLNEDELQFTTVRIQCYGKQPRLVRQVAEAVRRLITNFGSSGDSVNDAKWGDLTINGCNRETGWFVIPYFPTAGNDEWVFGMSSSWRVGYDAVIPQDGRVELV